MVTALKDAVTGASKLAGLLKGAEAAHVGFVVRMGYDSATLVTNDAWRIKANGLPLNALLLATAIDPEKYAEASKFEQMAILLRVTSTARLPQDSDNFAALVQHHQSHESVPKPNELDGMDPITHSQLQFSGIECRVLGTFYEDNNELHFGADAEDFQSFSALRVYKPSSEGLLGIVNYVDPVRAKKAESDAETMGFSDLPEPFSVGSVRFTSTTRLQKQAASTEVPVAVHPSDFLARRTAVLGMTRTGKSNTVKTTVAAVQMASFRAGVKIGQIIFDINGEYANANKQDDGSSIYDVFSDNTVRYRGLKTDGFFDIRDNFYQALEEGLELIQTTLAEDGSNRGEDMQSLINLNLTEPDTSDKAEYTHWQRRAAFYRALLFKAGYQPSSQDKLIKLPIGKNVFEKIYDHYLAPDVEDDPPPSTKEAKVTYAKDKLGDPSTGIDISDAVQLFLAIRSTDLAMRNAGSQIGLQSSGGGPWLREDEKGLLNLLAGENTSGARIRGARAVGSAGKEFHSPTGLINVAGDIYEHLSAGRVVIVDLSVGVESVRKARAQNIAHKILTESSMTFTDGGTPPQIVVYAEEAHNLIGKDASFDSTWPRIAKEGAKFGIALVYSTQEPSSVHPNILANTENWFVTHLNNENELRTLARYYDFEDFAVGLKRAHDVGFARIKTLSSSYVVPTQIKLFDPEALTEDYNALTKPDWYEQPPTPSD